MEFVDRTLNPIDLDPRALAAACLLGIVAVLIGGLWPAWIGTHRDPVNAVRGSAVPIESRSARATSRVLLVGQIALAGTLLVGSTVLVRTFVNLISADRGVDVGGVVRSQVVLLDGAIDATRDDRSKREQTATTMAAAIQDRLTLLPAVESVAFSTRVPPESATTAQPAVLIGADVPCTVGCLYGPGIRRDSRIFPGLSDSSLAGRFHSGQRSHGRGRWRAICSSCGPGRIL